MNTTNTYLITISTADPKSPSLAQEHDTCSEKERLDMERQDYFFKVQERNKESQQIHSFINSEYSNLMRLLTSLSTLGIGAMLFQKEVGKSYPTAFWFALIFMTISLISAALSYVVSIRVLLAWANELRQLDKPYESMQQVSNDLTHAMFALSAISFLISCAFYLCYVTK